MLKRLTPSFNRVLHRKDGGKGKSSGTEAGGAESSTPGQTSPSHPKATPDISEDTNALTMDSDALEAKDSHRRIGTYLRIWPF
jgi:hypothetical protein